MSEIVIDIQYLPSIQFFSEVLKVPVVRLEKYEHYEKGSYRNRCYIAGANGKLRLTVPLKKGKHEHVPMHEVRISYDHNWQKEHWQSICTAYRTSPYFEFYEHEFEPFYMKRYESLYEFNWQLIQCIVILLGVEVNFQHTTQYSKEVENDLRSYIHPKKNIENEIKYHQVFDDKYDFIPNLSIIDLLFNEGPNAKQFLS